MKQPPSVITPIRATINYLRLCQKARKQGMQISFTTDPTWLVHMAINRRAGWLDDPSEYRGSAMPVQRNRNKAHAWDKYNRRKQWSNLEYPVKASGSRFTHLRNLAHDINTPRLVVYLSRLGEWRKMLLARMPDRFSDYND